MASNGTSETWISVRDARKMSLYMGTYLYALGKKGTIVTRKSRNGRREYTRESIQAYLDAVEAKRQEREERALSGDDGAETRMTSKACDMITRKVTEDPNLSQGQKDTFLQAIESYRAYWDARYAKRKSNN